MNKTPVDRYAAVKADKKRRKEESKRRAVRNPFSDALSVACDQCGIKYRAIPAPRNIAEFNLVTSPTTLTTYQDRQRRANVPNSYEVVTEDDGRWNGDGVRQEWVVTAV